MNPWSKDHVIPGLAEIDEFNGGAPELDPEATRNQHGKSGRGLAIRPTLSRRAWPVPGPLHLNRSRLPRFTGKIPTAQPLIATFSRWPYSKIGMHILRDQFIAGIEGNRSMTGCGKKAVN
jgi:hypothetical protein